MGGLLPRLNHRLGGRIGCLLVHNFPLPVYEVISNGYRVIVQARELGKDDRTGRTASQASWLLSGQKRILHRLKAAHTEVNWYLEQVRNSAQCKRILFREDLVAAHVRKKRLKELQSDVVEQ